MNVRSKEFWMKVKEEYKPDYSWFICDTSEVFRIQWNNVTTSREIIKEEAKLFIKDDSFEIGIGVLFTRAMDIRKVKLIQIRKDFIDHMINKYS